MMHTEHAAYYETSARKVINVEEVFQDILRSVGLSHRLVPGCAVANGFDLVSRFTGK